MDQIYTKKQLIEGYGLDEIDKYEAFIRVYTQWVKDRFQEDTLKYPFTYLVKKHMKDFYTEVLDEDVEDEDDDFFDDFNRWTILSIVDKLIEMEKVSIPTLRPRDKLTNQFPDVISHFIRRLELPDYVTLDLKEDEPYTIVIRPQLDFVKMMNTPGKRPYLNSSNLERKLENYFVNYMGMKMGNPLYGELELSVRSIFIHGFEDWKKNVWDKVLRKGIKSLDNSQTIKRMTLEVRTNLVRINLVYTSWSSHQNRTNFKDNLKTYLESQGYTSDKFEITD